LSRAVPRQSWSNMLVEAFGRKNETYEFCKEVESFTEAAHAGWKERDFLRSPQFCT